MYKRNSQAAPQTCQGKTTFLTWDQANKAARKMRRANDKSLAPYRCPYCRQWHIGGQAWQS
jgi:hypothetical protein